MSARIDAKAAAQSRSYLMELDDHTMVEVEFYLPPDRPQRVVDLLLLATKSARYLVPRGDVWENGKPEVRVLAQAGTPEIGLASAVVLTSAKQVREVLLQDQELAGSNGIGLWLLAEKPPTS